MMIFHTILAYGWDHNKNAIKLYDKPKPEVKKKLYLMNSGFLMKLMKLKKKRYNFLLPISAYHIHLLYVCEVIISAMYV
jgi:hypothetical protein